MNFIFALFIFSILLQLGFYLFFQRNLSIYHNSPPKKGEKNPVSVIICAKDEAENLQNFLPYIYEQDYPVFEVVLIDDRSKDDKTWNIMQNFKEKFPSKTRVVRVEYSDNPRFIGNKKYALTLGIKAAKHDYLLFTDADCRPVTNKWIDRMASAFTEKKDLVLGYGKYKQKKGLLNLLIRYETLQTAIQYFSYAIAGLPYMGVGRNLAYKKKLFFDNNGFYHHMDILSGDDDLFVNAAGNKENTSVCMDPGAFTMSLPEEKWKKWIYQKRRHISTAKYYKTKHKFLLAIYYFSLFAFYFSAFFLLVNHYQWKIVAALIILRYSVTYFIQKNWAMQLREEGLTPYLFFLEPLLILFQLYIFIVNLFFKPKTWAN